MDLTCAKACSLFSTVMFGTALFPRVIGNEYASARIRPNLPSPILKPTKFLFSTTFGRAQGLHRGSRGSVEGGRGEGLLVALHAVDSTSYRIQSAHRVRGRSLVGGTGGLRAADSPTGDRLGPTIYSDAASLRAVDLARPSILDQRSHIRSRGAIFLANL
jgi:hypothetical protein